MDAFELIGDKKEGKKYNERQTMHELTMIDDHELMINCVCLVLNWASAGSAGYKVK